MNELSINAIVNLARQAGHKILEFYRQDNAIQKKSDSSPVTAADLAAHEVIAAGLKRLTPDLPVLSEEGKTIAFAERSQWTRYWLVDPLDGTRDFLEQNDEFTVNIALIEKNQPILGIVYAPALSLMYFAEKEQGAFKQVAEQSPQKIHTHACNAGDIKVAASRHHGFDKLAPFLQSLKNATVVQRGSALKFALVAEGSADVYPRLSPTSEWDTAAGQCVLEAAGGKVLDLQGKPLQYNTKELLLNPSFLAIGDAKVDWLKYL